MWKFPGSFAPPWREEGGFDAVVFLKWWIFCFSFTRVIHHVIREIICRCSRIILALSYRVRCFLLGYSLSPPRACLTISYHSARAACTRLHYRWISSLLYKKSSICGIITALQTVCIFFYYSSWEPAGGSDSEDFTVLIHKLLHEWHSNELCCLAFIIAQIIFPL